MYKFLKYIPANEVVFAQAEVKAHLSRFNSVCPLSESLEIVTANAIEAPRSFTRFHSQTRFLSVDREYRKLGFSQSTYKNIKLIR